MKIYLDVSCLNRPFDDQTQMRIHLESEAVILVLDRIDAGIWQDLSSHMVEIEVQAIRDETRRRRVLQLLPECRIELSQPILDRARELASRGFGVADAVHVAAAEAQQADVLLTCDDRMLRCGQRHADELKVRLANPLEWIKEQLNATNLG